MLIEEFFPNRITLISKSERNIFRAPGYWSSCHITKQVTSLVMPHIILKSFVKVTGRHLCRILTFDDDVGLKQQYYS